MDAVGKIQQARLEQLASQGAGVLQYVYDTPERTTDTAHALAMARDAFKRRNAMPRSVNDRDARRKLLEEDETLRLFARTHPRIFEMVTDVAQGPRNFEVLQELGAVRSQVEGGKSESEANVHVSSILMDRCRTDAPVAENRQDGVEGDKATGKGDAAEHCTKECSVESRSSTPAR